MIDRVTVMRTWLDGLGYVNYTIEVASEDASFRRYFRLTDGVKTRIIMDAPPDKESCDSFVAIAKQLRAAGLNAPEIIHENHDEGFLLLTDFGDESYLQVLNKDSAPALYGAAIHAITRMQSGINADDLPLYDEPLLRREMDLFSEWFLGQLLEIELTPDQQATWDATTDVLVQNALAQPRAFVHRDYHGRNLMRLAQDNPGIIDFQDAVNGPITYDLVSLLRDCYIEWPQQQVEQWVMEYYQTAGDQLLKGINADTLMTWFNLMGVQRHLKAVGIFSRLKIRDGKSKFLHDVPRTLNYIYSVASQHSNLGDLYTLINELKLFDRIDSVLCLEG